MKAALPELRGSHLASRLERKRARRVLRRAQKKKERESMRSQNQPVASDQGSVLQRRQGSDSATRRTVRKTGYKPLPAHLVSLIVSEIAEKGREHVVAIAAGLSEDYRRHSILSKLRDIQRDPARRWNSTSLSVLTRLAAAIRDRRAGNATRPGAARATALAAAAPPAAPPAPPGGNGFSPSSPEFLQALIQSVTTAVVTTMMPLLGQQQSTAPQLPQSGHQLGPDGEPPVKDFPELSPPMQRAVMNTMHDRYARIMERQGIDHPYREAWRQSYQAFFRETGINVEAMASEESDRSGHRVRPLHIIERSGWMVRFWRIVRKEWGDTKE